MNGEKEIEIENQHYTKRKKKQFPVRVSTLNMCYYI